MTFTEILDNPKSYAIVEQIEELLFENEPELVRIRTDLLNELKTEYGYEYKF